MHSGWKFYFIIFFILFLEFGGYGQTMVAPARTRDGWGYVRKDGSWMVPPSYDRFWEDGQYIVAENSNETVLWEFQEGMAGIRMGSEWGFIDTSGKEIIEHRFKEIRDFNESLAAVNYKGSWGFIDKKGQWVIQPQYDEARSFYGGLAAVCVKNKWGLIDTSGNFVIPAMYQELRNNTPHLIAAKLKRWGFIDHSNKWVIEPVYASAYNFSNGMARVETEGRWNYINSSGILISKKGFDKTMPFYNNLGRVRNLGLWYFVDTTGAILNKMKFLHAEDFSEDLARVHVDSGWGYINRDGSWAISPKYYFAGNFNNGIARVKKITGQHLSGIEEWIFIDKTGKRIFADKYFEKVEDFSNGYARVRQKGKWGYLDTAGNFLIKPAYDNCLDFLPIH